MPRYEWKPENQEIRNAIIITLLKADMGFTEILKDQEMNGKKLSPRTLSKYLKGLEKDHCIRKVPRGKREIYRVLKGNPEVDALIKRFIIVSGKINLENLSEKELLDIWIESLKFALLNVFQMYMEIGARARGEKIKRSRGIGVSIPIGDLLSEYLLDLAETCRFYGGVLVKGIKEGHLNTEKVWAARNEILEEIKRKRPNIIE